MSGRRTVVITGSTRGIGLHMAAVFLKEGCDVTISGRSGKLPASAQDILGTFHTDRVHYIQCDVTEKAQIEKLWQGSLDRWGRIDIWINNAGVNCSYEHICETDKCNIDNVIDTNIRGMIYGSQVAAAGMIKQGFGQIWNMEGLGSNGMIQPKTVLYGTTKRALTYFTRGLAKELTGTGVLVGRLSPGMVLTDFITKDPQGDRSPVLDEKSFKRIFNILADRPEVVAAFLVPRILKNNKNDAHIVRLTNMSAIGRFITAPFIKRKLIQ